MTGYHPTIRAMAIQRAAKGLAQQQIADELAIAQSTVSRWLKANVTAAIAWREWAEARG